MARESPASTRYVSEAALRAGCGELAELFAHVAANLFTNYFNHYMRTEPD